HRTVTALYHSKFREAETVRQARRQGYRAEVWQLLQEAMTLETPAKEVTKLRKEAVACMGDFVGFKPRIWPRDRVSGRCQRYDVGWEGDAAGRRPGHRTADLQLSGGPPHSRDHAGDGIWSQVHDRLHGLPGDQRHFAPGWPHLYRQHGELALH